jgi:hypothetical protein
LESSQIIRWNIEHYENLLREIAIADPRRATICKLLADARIHSLLQPQQRRVGSRINATRRGA